MVTHWTLCNLAFVPRCHNLINLNCLVHTSAPFICNFHGLVRLAVNLLSKSLKEWNLAISLFIHNCSFRPNQCWDLFVRRFCSHITWPQSIDNYKCQYGVEYTGKTNKKLEISIDQPVPAKICHGRCDSLHKLVNTSGLAVVEHSITNPVYTMVFPRDSFTIISRAHCNFHLRILESS